MKRSMTIAALVVAVLLVGAGSYYVASSMKGGSSTSTPSGNGGSSTTTTASNGVEIVSDTITVNATAGSGTWAITLNNTGSLTVSSITVNLFTPSPGLLCSGAAPSNGLSFKNCPVAIGSPLPPGSTVSGGSSSAIQTGPASAVSGTSYPVAVHLAFTSGTTAWVNSTATAKSG